MAINLIDVGATANDGTGDSIRAAFQTVNNNFDFINGGLYAGSEASTISATSVQGGYIISNSYITSNTIAANGITISGSYGNLYVQGNGATIVGNLTVVGNLSVTGSQQATQSSNSTAPIILIHANAAPYTLNDGKDIGLEWQYYDGTDKYAFLGWQNATGSLVYLDNVVDTSNVITSGTFGNVQFGQLLLSNSTVATSNTTGALRVTGGGSIGGNLYVAGNLRSTFANVANLSVTGWHVGNMNFAGADTIFINGSPVQTAATAFNGGTVSLATIFNDATQSTSTSSGAVTIPNGGLGVSGNIWTGNIHVNHGGNVRANVQGNIFTASQPFITSLGTLSGLTISGQLNVRDIVPETNLLYSLGIDNSTRWNKLWGFDADFSGAITLTGELTASSNININRAGVAALRTSTSVAEVFNTTASIIRVGGAGVTEFNSNSQAISVSTGAVRLQGGMSINTGNLYIGASAGNSIITSGAIAINSNTQSTSTTTGALKVNGGIAITSGNLYISGSAGAAIVATGNILPSGNVITTNNIGSSTAWWNNFYGVSVQAQYADLAEIYVSDKHYSEGTVVVFGGDAEITATNIFADTRVAGVISKNPAYLMNATTEGLPVALRGRVMVKVVGTVTKGDLLVSSGQAEFAQSVGQDNSFGAAVFAKSLVTDGRNGNKLIEAVIL